MNRESVIKKVVNDIGLTCDVNDLFVYTFVEWINIYRNISKMDWTKTNQLSNLDMINFIQHYKVLAEVVGNSVVFWTSERFSDDVLCHIKELERYQKCEHQSLGFVYYIGEKSDHIISKLIKLFPNLILDGNSKMDFSKFVKEVNK